MRAFPARREDGETLLFDCMELYSGRRPMRAALIRPEYAKPYICGFPEFSVSHSGSIWAVAIAEAPVGLDIQKKRPSDWRSVAKRFFNAEETAFVAENGEDAFFEVWAAKEAYVKYLGTGIDGDFSGFSTVERGRFMREVNGASLVFPRADALSGYSAAVCGAALEGTDMESGL